ncbi:hypothetical protein [Trinickia sp.]|uniref:hypothetical protein n=1 Tax=Trinickia sp. TaxID=2571163 RepID=UPI003F7E3D5D
MSMEIGTVAIALAVPLITFLLFGKNVGNSFGAKFLYWLKSTMTMALLLFAWFAYNESIYCAARIPIGGEALTNRPARVWANQQHERRSLSACVATR